MAEPKLLFCGVRDCTSDTEIESEYHIECRFEDGQKLAAIIVDGEFGDLAHKVAELLNQHYATISAEERERHGRA